VSASEYEDESDGQGEKSRKRHRRRRRSPVSGDDGEEDGKRHKRKHKRKHRQDKELSRAKPAPPEASEPSGERKETEEEYDARLEREENERLAAARQRELEQLKRQHEQETSSTNGVRFKGISFFFHSSQHHS
jgi:peptidyl-prolyl isomerase G (cyclophilin G)